MFNQQELFEQLQYEIEDQAEFYDPNNKVVLTENESAEIAKMILEKDPEIEELFGMDPSIVLTEMDNENYDWAPFHNALFSVITYYKASILQKIFLPKEDFIY